MLPSLPCKILLTLLFSCLPALAQDRPPRDDNPATPAQVLNHDLVHSTQIGPLLEEDGRTLIPTPWREEDDVVEGWDWALPSGVRPAENSGLIFGGKGDFRVPGNQLTDVSIFWKDVEPEEGRLDFEPLRRKLENLPEGVVGVRLHFYGSVADSINQRTTAPDWLRDYDMPIIDMTSMEGRFQLFCYPIWDERFHERYLRVVRALGESRIPQMDGLHIIYVGGVSKSWGEEMYIPRDVGAWCEENAGLTPDALETCLKERLDGWAAAFQGVEHKLAWVGAGNDTGSGSLDYHGTGQRVLDHAYSLGMGQRCGFVENYLYHLENSELGQHVDDDGYLYVDEDCPPIRNSSAFGDENEEYGPYWTGRFGPLETHAYRYHASMLRSLQMRRNYLWMSKYSVMADPALTCYVSLTLGCDVDNSPDAFCVLRESDVRASFIGRTDPEGRGAGVLPVKNFERWLYQRDRPGAETVACVEAAQHEMMWMVPEGYKHDRIARRTDLATGNDRIEFAVEDRFLSGEVERVAIKVVLLDKGRGRLSLVAKDANGVEIRRTLPQCQDSGDPYTATFFLSNVLFDGEVMEPDFWIEAAEEDVYVSMVRVVKLEQ